MSKTEKESFSQGNEDRLIGEIMEQIGDSNHWCVEFGAWDGKYASNSRYFIKEKGYKAVLIEPDDKKFSELKINYSKNPNVTSFCSFVERDGEKSLDSILGKTNIPKNFDFCSIDIDGNDYHVWQGLEKYRPKLVVVEFNPSIPPGIDYVQEYKSDINRGASKEALEKMADKKGYFLAATLSFNCFFVDRKYEQKFKSNHWSDRAVRRDLSCVTSCFVGYDGRLILHGAKSLIWHGVPYNECCMQPLPKFVGCYPPNYNNSQKKAFELMREFALGEGIIAKIEEIIPYENDRGFECYIYVKGKKSYIENLRRRLVVVDLKNPIRRLVAMRGGKNAPSWWGGGVLWNVGTCRWSGVRIVLISSEREFYLKATCKN